MSATRALGRSPSCCDEVAAPRASRASHAHGRMTSPSSASPTARDPPARLATHSDLAQTTHGPSSPSIRQGLLRSWPPLPARMPAYVTSWIGSVACPQQSRVPSCSRDCERQGRPRPSPPRPLACRGNRRDHARKCSHAAKQEGRPPEPVPLQPPHRLLPRVRVYRCFPVDCQSQQGQRANW